MSGCCAGCMHTAPHPPESFYELSKASVWGKPTKCCCQYKLEATTALVQG